MILLSLEKMEHITAHIFVSESMTLSENNDILSLPDEKSEINRRWKL